MLIHCPTCSTEIEVAESQIGAKGRCPGCATKFVIPETAAEPIEVLELGQSRTAPDQGAHPKLRVPGKPPVTKLAVGFKSNHFFGTKSGAIFHRLCLENDGLAVG